MDLLGWALVALVIALAAALLGFTRVAAAAAGIGRALFVLFLIIFVVLLVARLVHATPLHVLLR